MNIYKPRFCINKIYLKGRLIKSLRDLIKYVGVSQILWLHKIVQLKIWDYLALVNLKDCPGLVLMKFYEFLRAKPIKSSSDFIEQPLRGKFCYRKIWDNKNNGLAMVLVLSILGVVSLIGFSFLYMAQVQLRGANVYAAKLQAKYLAEAGVSHAKAVLAFDKGLNALDSYDDLWGTVFQGTDVDLNQDGEPDSKWFYIKDGQGNDIGRYAVLVTDESSKININTAGRYNEAGFIQGYNVFEVSLNKFLNNFNLDGQSITNQILDYRYGADKSPGIKDKDDNGNNWSLENDFLDNDADGIIDEDNEGIDEPQEFDIDKTRGDDYPFAITEELKDIGAIDKDIFKGIAKYISVSSKDQEIDKDDSLRQNINHIKSDNLIKVMIDKGISSPWQMAVNVVDSLDTNLSRATIFKYYNLLEPVKGQPIGNWVWVNDHYECDVPQGEGIWQWDNLPFPDGEYYCFIYGLDGEIVGDVEIEGLIQKNMHSADVFSQTQSKKITIKDGEFSLSIINNGEFGQACYFKYIELIPGDLESGPALLSKEYQGTEAIRINEIMVKPKIEMNTTISSGGGGDWVWQGDLFANAQSESGKEGEGVWAFVNIPDGYYYLRLFGKEGEFIGDVEVNGLKQLSMRDGDYFNISQTVAVNSNQLIIKIQNNFKDKTCYFKGIELSQQPDAEYVELVNISSNVIDLSGWILETTGQEAVSTFIPQGTKIPPYDYLVLCVDNDDRTTSIDFNNISFSNTWGIQKAVQLDFSKDLDKDFDFLKDAPIEGENYLILKDANGFIVDKIEYLNTQVVNYLSLERSDPADQKDSNDDYEFDGWYLSGELSGGTPGQDNDNSGMKKDEFSNHNIQEINVRNYPASNILDLAYIPKSDNWQEIGLSDISLLVDSLTVFGITLYPSGNHIEGWTEISGKRGGFLSVLLEEEGVWRWENLENGIFFIAIKGQTNEALAISYKKKDGSWQLLAEDIIPDQEGLVFCGMINIGTDDINSTVKNTLEIKLKNLSDTKTAHFYYLRLCPKQEIYGRININTAPKEVLLSLPNIDDSAASLIINNRPFGMKDGVYKGIGDLFLSDIFNNDPEKEEKLGSFSNLITVRSDVFEVISRADILDTDRITATQQIKTIIERD